MSSLALLGGEPVVPRAARRVEWPVVTDEDRAAVVATIDSGRTVSNYDGETEVSRLEEEWARAVGCRSCVGVSNGTAALAIALAAAGVEPGDEVVVPALSFIASGIAPLHQLALPVFVDVDPLTFTMDPARVREAVTPRTAAIMPVHLHGLPADMDELLEVASEHGLAVIEDAAQAHGARYRGRTVGGIGTAAGFSLNSTKNLPTCGEGGLLTTDDSALAERATMLRQFGEIMDPGRPRDYLAYTLGWNCKLNAVQAAFARSQLRRFADYERRRQENVRAFLEAVSDLPGLQAPSVPPDRTHVWHILRFRVRPDEAGFDGIAPGAFRSALRRVLRAEGVPFSRYQLTPLPEQEALRRRKGFGRDLPWRLNSDWRLPGPDEIRVTREVIDDSLTLQKRQLNPDSGPLLRLYATALLKVWESLDVVAHIARQASGAADVAVPA